MISNAVYLYCSLSIKLNNFEKSNFVISENMENHKQTFEQQAYLA